MASRLSWVRSWPKWVVTIFDLYCISIRIEVCICLNYGWECICELADDLISASSTRNSSMQLCEWLEHLYWLLLSKFSLYFYDTLSAQCSNADVEHTVAAIKTPNFVHAFFNFHRKSDACFIALIVNGTSCSDSSTGKSCFRWYSESKRTIVFEKPSQNKGD